MDNIGGTNMTTFKIDFFEFSFLVEACIPPKPIARAVFWDKVCDEYYHQMTSDERKRLWQWVQLNPNFEHSNDDCKLFYNRYDPLNQYELTCLDKKKKVKFKCFKQGDRYYTNKNTSIVEDSILEINKI